MLDCMHQSATRFFNLINKYFLVCLDANQERNVHLKAETSSVVSNILSSKWTCSDQIWLSYHHSFGQQESTACDCCCVVVSFVWESKCWYIQTVLLRAEGFWNGRHSTLSGFYVTWGKVKTNCKEDLMIMKSILLKYEVV